MGVFRAEGAQYGGHSPDDLGLLYGGTGRLLGVQVPLATAVSD